MGIWKDSSKTKDSWNAFHFSLCFGNNNLVTTCQRVWLCLPTNIHGIQLSRMKLISDIAIRTNTEIECSSNPASDSTLSLTICVNPVSYWLYSRCFRTLTVGFIVHSFSSICESSLPSFLKKFSNQIVSWLLTNFW